MIVIHIGMPKAGSTTLQQFLKANDEALREMSIDYPRAGREHPTHNLNHRNFANGILERNRRILERSGSLDDIVRYLGDNEYASTILSSEELFRAGEPAIRRAQALLAPIGREIRIILIIRDPRERLPSAYAQRVRFGVSADDFDTFFKFRAVNDEVDQFKVAERWAKVFGWPAIRVRLLSPPALRGGDLITDFLASAGLDPDAPELAALPRPPRANESPGWKTLEGVRAYFGGLSGLRDDHPLMRMESPDTPQKRKIFGFAAEAIGRELGWHEDKGLYLTDEQAALCADNHASTIQMLNEHLVELLPTSSGVEECEFVGRPFLPDVSKIDGAELQAFYDGWSASLESQ
ncbi:MAG: hypothetical protein ABI056_05225 [Caulobacteraceae bacterium]